MKTEFEIAISFRTPSGFRACAHYALGENAAFAHSVFEGLRGCEDMDGRAVLHLDLLELNGALPEKVNTIACKLNELSANCEYITRELFRYYAIEDEKIRTDKPTDTSATI